VKKGDTEAEFCHATRSSAEDQLAALYASEADQGLAELAEELVQLVVNRPEAEEVATMAVTNSFTNATDNGGFGGRPNQGTDRDKRLRRNRRGQSYQDDEREECGPNQHRMPDGTCMDNDEEMALEGPLEPWHGVLAVEGTETGDGREFAPGSLEWPDLEEVVVPLSWQEQSEERHGHSIVVGRIQRIERDGNLIRGWGVIKRDAPVTEDLRNELAGGISVDVDSVKDSDVELVFPDTPAEETADEGEDGILMLFGPPPDKVVFHRGRLRGATMVALPAFVEARIHLGTVEEFEEEDVVVAALSHPVETFGAISGHKTGTAEGSWDAGSVQSRLPSPMPVATARGMYAWMADGAVEDGKVVKADLKFPHHNSPGGPANMTACSAGIAALNGARGGSSIPGGDRSAVHSHLAGHLRAGGKTPPELAALEDVLVASAVRVGGNDEVIAPLYPPGNWIENPQLPGPTPWTIDDGGKAYGHLCLWGTCHTTFADRCVTPPRGSTYSYFLKGELKTREGKLVGVGHVTLGTGHAAARYGAAPAAAHYDQTGFAAADVVVGEDQYGIWVAGSVRPGLSERRLRELRSASLSGDWRRIGGRMQLVAILAVNVPGFPVPRMRARMDNDDMLALTAAGVVTEERAERYRELQKRGDGHGTLRVRKVVKR
jgi:hypothetical protein